MADARALRRDPLDGGAACGAPCLVRSTGDRRQTDRAGWSRRAAGADPLHQDRDAHAARVFGRGELCPFTLGIAALEVLRARTIGVIGLVGVVCGCVSGGDFAPETYVVRPQDTLYGIAWRHDLDYHDLARWNHIGSDYRIAVGQILILRPTAGDAAHRPPAPAPAAPRKQTETLPRAERSAPMNA